MIWENRLQFLLPVNTGNLNFYHDYILKFSTLDLLTGFQYESSTFQFGLEKGLSEDLSIQTFIHPFPSVKKLQ